MSEKAFRQMHFVSFEIADSSIYYTQRREREERANAAFNALHGTQDLLTSDIFLLDILREEMQNDDPRLR